MRLNNSFILFFILCLFVNCERSINESQTPIEINRNENLLIKVLLHTDEMPISIINSSSYVDLRNTVINNIKETISQSESSLQNLNDSDLSWVTIMLKFLVESEIRNKSQLRDMTLNECKDVVILENAKNTSYSSSYYESKSLIENLNTAYQWWFKKNPSISTLINNLNNVARNNPIHNLKDDRNMGMDVLRIVKANEKDFIFLGISHYMVKNNEFRLSLSGSNDLRNWTFISDMGVRAHQGDIEKWGDGYLIVNEQDIVQGSNNIQVRFFSSYEDLKNNKPSYDKSIERTFALSAEGTPDIRKIEGESPEKSHILIGFHYYEDMIKDQLAFGILKNFNEWKAWKDPIANYNIKQMGLEGNIGGRDYFNYLNSTYVLQEAQISRGDWGGWRLLIGNGFFYHILQPVTSLRSMSFANPGILSLGEGKFVVTSFMHSAGNAAEETGELIYHIDLSKSISLVPN